VEFRIGWETVSLVSFQYLLLDGFNDTLLVFQESSFDVISLGDLATCLVVFEMVLALQVANLWTYIALQNEVNSNSF